MRISRVHVLPREVAEKIAAGEVIERPANVVKELVENSIDAGATRVTVETEGGGKQRIRVADDGTGMTAEEARLAIQPHATSKLRTADDLFAIRTLGFRGEALPSIAAISHFELLTRMEGEEAGTRLAVEGGRLVADEPAAAPVGTGITVRRLFFNIPARQKFLRSDATEAAQITELVQRLAVAHPGVSFRLLQDGKETLISPGSDDPFNALLAVWGRPVAKDLLRVGAGTRERGNEGMSEGENEETGSIHSFPRSLAPSLPRPLSVSGFIGRPSATRANRHLQWFYVNGRFVRSPLFYRALDEAYRATMPQGRYPLAVLALAIEPDAVDVNVHPSKIEVRFQDESAVYGALVAAVRETLGPATAPAETGPTALREAAPAYIIAPEVETEGEGEAESAAPAVDLDAPGDPFAESPTPRLVVSPEETGTLPFADSAVWHAGGTGSQRFSSPPRGGGAMPPRPHASPPSGERHVRPPQPPAVTPGPEPGIPELTPLGQARDLFVVAEGEGRFWIIDQHVAHERILYERLSDPSRRETAEPLLFALTLPLDQRQALVLEEHRAQLNEMGFQIEPFGDNNYIVRAVPLSLVGKNYEQALRDMVDELGLLSEGGRIHLRREQVAMAAAGRACKASIKAGKTLSRAEMTRLLADLRRTRNPYTCPHGRPIFLAFDEEEVAELFGGPTCG